MKYYVLALFLASTVEGNMIHNALSDARKIATPDAAGKFSQINCGAECCPCASCCPCPCGGDSKNDEAAQAADRAIQAAEDLKAR